MKFLIASLSLIICTLLPSFVLADESPTAEPSTDQVEGIHIVPYRFIHAWKLQITHAALRIEIPDDPTPFFQIEAIEGKMLPSPENYHRYGYIGELNSSDASPYRRHLCLQQR